MLYFAAQFSVQFCVTWNAVYLVWQELATRIIASLQLNINIFADDGGVGASWVDSPPPAAPNIHLVEAVAVGVEAGWTEMTKDKGCYVSRGANWNWILQ